MESNDNLDKKLMKFCKYLIISAIVTYLAFKLLDNLPFFLGRLTSIFGTLINLIKPLIMGLITAYLLHFTVYGMEHFLESHSIFKKQGTRRNVGIIVSYFGIFALIIGFVWGIYLMIGGQISRNTNIANVVAYIIDYLNNSELSPEAIQKSLESLGLTAGGTLMDQITSLLASLQTYIGNALQGMFSSLAGIAGNLIALFAAFFLSIYLLKDKEYFMGLWNKLFYIIFRNGRTGQSIRHIMSIANTTFSNYIVGQLLEACVVAVMATIALFIIGIDSAVMIGIIAGITNLIPYIGPWIGTALAAVMALLSGEPIKVIWVVIGMQIVQQIDNNLMAPRVVGSKVGLHAVFTMLAILIGGSTSGLAGMLIAVPVAATLKIVIAEWYDRHFAGVDVTPPDTPAKASDKNSKDPS